jgi:hypothetical protein
LSAGSDPIYLSLLGVDLDLKFGYLPDLGIVLLSINFGYLLLN